MPASTKKRTSRRTARPHSTEVLTPSEVERITGLGRTTVYAALRSGQLPGIRVGRRWLIGRDALDRLLSGELAGSRP